MREKEVEEFLVKSVKARGGLCPKFTSPSSSGYPDRLVLLPGAKVLFVEVKAPGKKPRKLQDRRIKALCALGFKALFVDSKEKVLEVLDEV